MTDQPRVEFRGRLVAERHAHAQSVTAYDDSADSEAEDAA